MHNKLTQVDIQKMQEEIDYREVTLRPKLLEDVKTARAFGDLSENDEYKIAKREKNLNESRIRHLKRMINSAVIIDVSSKEDEVGVFDKVTVFIEEDSEEETYTIVTNTRQDVLKNFISLESPMGKALLKHKEGDRVLIKVNNDYSYYVKIVKIEKGTDDPSLPIRKY